MIARIISGGQTGVDIAALRAAKARGVPTGGAMPLGWRTLTGARPEYAALYGMTEHPSAGYPGRTYQNVRDASITVRIAVDFESAGERCTMSAIRQYRRPWVDIHLFPIPRGHVAGPGDITKAAEAIRGVAHRLGRPGPVVVVNVAGNSESTAPGIESIAEMVVKAIIDRTSA